MTLPRRPTPLPVSHGGYGDRTGGWLALHAPAKINLFLEVLGKRDDGFHAMETVMVPLRLADRLWLRSRPGSPAIELTVRGPLCGNAPADESNLVVRALRVLQTHADVEEGADVVLEKNIPSQAGMGGGSSDAASALLLANQAWRLDLGLNELSGVAAEVGSDVPFFLSEGAATCSGRGELVTPVASSSSCPCVVVKPQVGLSTAEVYGQLAAATNQQPRAVSRPLVQNLSSGNWRGVARELFNRLQEPAYELAPMLREIEKVAAQVSSFGVQMTGSGSAIFALMPNHRAARRAANWLAQQNIGWVAVTGTA